MSNATKQTAKKNDKDVEVLYQKMGNRWFAFSVVGGEVFMGSITQDEIDALEKREAEAARQETYEILGNS